MVNSSLTSFTKSSGILKIIANQLHILIAMVGQAADNEMDNVLILVRLAMKFMNLNVELS